MLLEVCGHLTAPAVLDPEELFTDGLWEILDTQASPVTFRSSLPAVTKPWRDPRQWCETVQLPTSEVREVISLQGALESAQYCCGLQVWC